MDERRSEHQDFIMELTRERYRPVSPPPDAPSTTQAPPSKGLLPELIAALDRALREVQGDDGVE